MPRPSKQQSFASFEFEQKTRVTRREKFLGEMDRVVPWARMEALVEAKYPTAWPQHRARAPKRHHPERQQSAGQHAANRHRDGQGGQAHRERPLPGNGAADQRLDD